MSDYILQMRIERLRENPLNSTIYDFNEEQLKELIKQQQDPRHNQE